MARTLHPHTHIHSPLQLFLFENGLPLVDRIDLNSEFREPGDNSYMRETVAYALMKCAYLNCRTQSCNGSQPPHIQGHQPMSDGAMLFVMAP